MSSPADFARFKNSRRSSALEVSASGATAPSRSERDRSGISSSGSMRLTTPSPLQSVHREAGFFGWKNAGVGGGIVNPQEGQTSAFSKTFQPFDNLAAIRPPKRLARSNASIIRFA